MMETEEIEEKKTYAVWLDKWLRAKRAMIKESTYIRYRNMIENHIKPELGNQPVSKIGTKQMEEFVLKKLTSGRLDGNGGLSPKSVADIWLVVKESFRYAQAYGEEAVCNLDRIGVKRKEREMRVLDKTEEEKLLSVLLKDMDTCKLGVFICLYTGIRLGELCALQWKNISLPEGIIRIEHTMQRLQRANAEETRKTQLIITEPKSCAAVRTIPLPDFLTEKIRPFTGRDEAYVLSKENVSLVEPRTMQNRFKAYLKEGQIADANFHALRHTFATRCVEAGFDTKTLSEILGHSSVKMTLDKYVHSSMQLKRENMEKLKLGMGTAEKFRQGGYSTKNKNL